MSTETAQRFGRVTMDDRGISQTRFLLFFGKAFYCAWSEISGWAVADSWLHDLKTGREKLMGRVVELHCGGQFHTISLSAKSQAFDAIVGELRRRAPDKETQSLVAEVSAIRQRMRR